MSTNTYLTLGDVSILKARIRRGVKSPPDPLLNPAVVVVVVGVEVPTNPTEAQRLSPGEEAPAVCDPALILIPVLLIPVLAASLG
jgi:hypothetical protein